MTDRGPNANTTRNVRPFTSIRTRTPAEAHARAVDDAITTLTAAIGETRIGDPWRFAADPAIIIDPAHILGGVEDLPARVRLAKAARCDVHVGILPPELGTAAVIIPVTDVQEPPRASL